MGSQSVGADNTTVGHIIRLLVQSSLEPFCDYIYSSAILFDRVAAICSRPDLTEHHHYTVQCNPVVPEQFHPYGEPRQDTFDGVMLPIVLSRFFVLVFSGPESR